MPSISLTVEQTKALIDMGQNQLFRLRFIDPKIPGHKANPDQLMAAESAIQKLESILTEDRLRTPTEWEKPNRRAPLQRAR